LDDLGALVGLCEVKFGFPVGREREKEDPSLLNPPGFLKLLFELYICLIWLLCSTKKQNKEEYKNIYIHSSKNDLETDISSRFEKSKQCQLGLKRN
jgi:hypothetical protein